ncbi:RTA1-domain-containing protein [Nadsonia fulvescens var. elongata DSM 6958]|uniref:RTA1-domain-containing protein n=1 Tax=Nadsonia fulvescens var. elongata DSM 6958 TaxID=857566 RepID=A0A1E3PQG1_9ASCO|nr:RTA1-domain-containing protein [Nadsonia fulvescens var. elongata DSM 6958]
MIDLISRANNENPLAQFDNNFGYYPAKAPSILFAILFGFQLIAIIYNHIRYRVWWPLFLTIGIAFETLGYATRSWLTWNPNTGGSGVGDSMYKCEYACLLIGPIFHAAFVYTVFGRLSRETPRNFTLIKPKLVAPCFFASDIISFLIQVAGAGVLLSASSSSAINTGNAIIQAGLAINLASFVLFLIFCSYFTYCIRKFVKSKAYPWAQYCTLLLWLSAFAILVRQVYRVIEFADGFYGSIAIHEVYFYVFDAVPIFVAGLVWCVFFPERFIYPGFYVATTSVGNETEESKQLNQV